MVTTWRDGATTGRTGREIENRSINTINVTQYGALGNDVDDSSAIESAVEDLTDGDTLYFPPGKYRYTTVSPSNGAAIYLNGLSNVTIWFAPGAELLMDNLSAGSGTSHGVFVKGACSNVKLVNVRVRWATAPSVRSTGDGFHVLGYPKASGVTAGWTGSTGTCVDVHLIDCEVVNAPQCGAIFMGCDRPVVENLLVRDTFADGLHFNACRRPRATGYTGYNTGDDGLATVTYYAANGDAPTTDVYTGQNGPFALATLNEWSNGHGQFTGIQVSGGNANGVRIAAAYCSSWSGVSVEDKTASAGIILDSGEAGGGFSWTYIASKGCTVTGATIEGCAIGVHARVYNSDEADNSRYWDHDVTFSDIEVRACSNRPILAQGNSTTTGLISGVNFVNIRCDQAGSNAGFTALRNARIDGVHTTGGCGIQVYGTDTAWSSAMSGLQVNNLQIDNLFADGGSVAFQDLRRCQIGLVRSHNSQGSGVTVSGCRELSITSIVVSLAHRANSGTSRGLQLSKAQALVVGQVTLTHDANTSGTWRSLEIGGGDATDISTDIVIDRFVYRNTINSAVPNVVIQGGGFAPTDYIYRLRHYNGGEASPIWRDERWGSTTWAENFAYSGTPEGQIVAKIGSTYQRTDGGAGTSFYVKESGTGATGWVAK